MKGSRIRHGKHGVLPAALVSSAAFLMPQLSSAQEAAASDGLEEIVVSAQFRTERLQDTPLAITAISDEMMRARGQDSIIQVTDQAPNVEIRQNAGGLGASTTAYIRGVGQSDFNFAFEPGVGMYIDDVYFPTMTGSAFNIVDLERVEVLRGPQGTLQGRNSIGGAIRLITKKPTGDGGGYAEVTTGQYKRFGAKAAADIKLADNLFARISGASNTQDGYVTGLDFACDQPAVAASLGIKASGSGKADCKTGTLGGQSYTAGRVNLRWLATEKFEVNLIGDLTNDKSETTASVILRAPESFAIGRSSPTDPIVYGPWFVPARKYVTYENYTDPLSPVTGEPYTTPPINYYTTRGAALVLDYALTDHMAVKSITSKRYLTNDFTTATDGSPLAGTNGFFELNGHSFQQELRLNGDVGPVDYTLGLFYFTSDYTSRERIDLGYIGPGVPFDFIGRDVTDTKAKAVFAHTVWHVTDKFNATVGLRYSDENKNELLGRLDPSDGGQTASTLPAFGELVANGGYAPVVPYNNNRIDYRISLDYRWNDNLMTYVTHSTGYKAGGVSPRFFFASHIIPFGPEELKAYEAGFKTDLLDNKLRINGAYFVNNYTDQQAGAPGGVCPGLTPVAPCFATFNNTDTRYKGAELEVTYRPTKDLLIDLSGSQIDSEYTRISPILLSDPNFISNPKGPTGIPQYKLSGGVQQTFHFANESSLTPRLDVNYEAERQSNDIRTLPVAPSFTVMNARLTYRTGDKNWESSVAVMNLTNKYYFYQISDSVTAGWANAQPAPPRTWAVTIRRTFD